MTNLRLGCALAATLLSAVPAFAAEHTLDIADRVGKFQTFYGEATAKPIDADARFALWQNDYGYAAVPPKPKNEAKTRKQHDAAWDKYPTLAPKLPALLKEASDDGNEAFARINDLFKTDDTPIHTRLVLYVGQFDNNAYSMPPMNGNPATTMMPVENTKLKLMLAHELTHTVHIQLAGVKNSFGAPVGETMFLEGLAMRTSQAVYPGLPETAYTQMEGDGDWLANCYAKKDKVLNDILPDLDKSGREIGMKYTFGQGNNGMQREAYCAAWVVMGKLLDNGKTLAELARVPEDQMVATIRAAITKM